MDALSGAFVAVVQGFIRLSGPMRSAALEVSAQALQLAAAAGGLWMLSRTSCAGCAAQSWLVVQHAVHSCSTDGHELATLLVMIRRPGAGL